jgi:hypothetical protein
MLFFFGYLFDSVDSLENRNVTWNSVLLILRYAFGYPYNIANLLLLKLNISIKCSIMELLLKSKTVQEHFITKEPVFHSRLANSLIKELSIFLQITVSALSTSYFSNLVQILTGMASQACLTCSTSSAVARVLVPWGYSLPILGYNFFRSSFGSSVPKELIVMLIVRRSASN